MHVLVLKLDILVSSYRLSKISVSVDSKCQVKCMEYVCSYSRCTGGLSNTLTGEVGGGV